MVKVSIIIPVYNAEKYLIECLDSIVSQSLTDIEVICIDDCSTDNSLKILKNYKNKYENFILSQQEKNSGSPGKLRNMGIDIAKGEYIGFIDSDDYVSNNYFESLYSCAISNNADMALNSVVIKFNEDGVTYIDDDKDDFFILDTPEKIFPRFLKCAYTPIKLYKKEFLNTYNIRCYEDRCIAEDNYITCISMALANKIAVIYDAQYYYRQHEKSMVSGIRTTEDFTMFSVYNAIDEKLETYIKAGLVSAKYRELMHGRKLVDFGYFWEKCDPSSRKAFKSLMLKNFPSVAHKMGFTWRGALFNSTYDGLRLVKRAVINTLPY